MFDYEIVLSFSVSVFWVVRAVMYVVFSLDFLSYVGKRKNKQHANKMPEKLNIVQTKPLPVKKALENIQSVSWSLGSSAFVSFLGF